MPAAPSSADIRIPHTSYSATELKPSETKSRPLETFLSRTAGLAWKVTQAVNCILPEGQLRKPAWAPSCLQKTRERSFPPFGIPRETDSLCPNCNIDVRKAILSGEAPIEKLSREPGVITAQILEERGRVLGVVSNKGAHQRRERLRTLQEQAAKSLDTSS
jgi:hypothetical protein